MTDYRKLCIELFGTDDEAEIRKLAGKPRGRKKSLTEKDVLSALDMLKDGKTVAAAAEALGVSRQTLSSYLNKRAAGTEKIKLNYMYRQKVCSVLFIDFLNKKVTVTNRTNDILHRAFGVKEDPTWEDLEVFLSERCFPESRGNKKDLLKRLSLSCYDPLSVIEKTKGRTADDDQYFNIYYYGDKNGRN